MQIRFIRIGSRNPLVGAALGILVLALVLAVVIFGLALLAGLAAVGAVVFVVRRLFGARRPAVASRPGLDPAREVFPSARAVVRDDAECPSGR